MMDLPWHLLHTWSSNGVLSQIFAVESGLGITLILWRVIVRRITRILTTTAVLGASAFLFCHPAAFDHPVPTGPYDAPFASNQP
jgi:hypothetical protein